jgi:hypothetical protein
MAENLYTLLMLALVSATVSVTVSRASIFNRPREWLSDRSEFFGKLLSCPYCLSHWVAFALVAVHHPQVLPVHWAVNFLTASFAVVTLTAFMMGGMFAAFQRIPAPHDDEEDAA